MNLFNHEHQKFFEGTLLLNAWYCSLYHNSEWNRTDVSLGSSFPRDWLNLNIGNITFNYNLDDIESKFDKAPKIEHDIILKRMDELKGLGPLRARGKYEIQFLFAFLSFIKNEPHKNRKYSVAPCSLPFHRDTMISTFSQYAEVPDTLYYYIEKGERIE